ncbi:MAG: hypothetical protein COB67_10920 [SAR324 cluster bacterium]|uniref:DUF3108 domain-containing protein n=1 Tax=SAR324 cluster bacterium TaxID=2024889 RepID=A0A2A4SVG4_9DELT|nr:MAG: hypothetical protein COB67_10920 [SAR324 cluster bacterium]
MFGKILNCCLVTFLLLVSGIAPAQELGVESGNSGIVEFKDDYQIFPAGQQGNSIYRERTHLVSRKNLILFDIHEAPVGYIYAGTTATKQQVLGYTGSAAAKFKNMGMGYYQLRTKSKKSSVSKLYRLVNDKIQDLLPNSRTANGLTVNKNGKAVFFHIAKGERVQQEDGPDRYRYTFKIHVVEPDSGQIITLPSIIQDFRSSLKIKWLSDNMLGYVLSDGQTAQISYR